MVPSNQGKEKQVAERGPHTRGRKARKLPEPARRTEREEQSESGIKHASQQQPATSARSGKPNQRQATAATPPLSDNDYKVVYRPRTGMKLSSWPDEKIAEGLARASGSHFKEFCAKVTIQTQWKQNLIIASTADEDYALKLGSINGIELGAATYEMTPYIKPLPGTAYAESCTVSLRVRRRNDLRNF
ncbi:hypothetical protein HPB49_010322 [Dermacentor silvarum]|uniref:Uncharacterized protein n=1 Tax=Dermacentor silvarum TaxID=543639 RepID=A0ACB8DZG7_DERSI|nr:hypothetical protein HPB49_010322 [Dermacentor silvarum]